jgi:hypothetical protein
MPDLSPEYAASRIVTAILTNQKLLCMPRAMYQLVALKGLVKPTCDVIPLLLHYITIMFTRGRVTGDSYERVNTRPLLIEKNYFNTEYIFYELMHTF